MTELHRMPLQPRHIVKPAIVGAALAIVAFIAFVTWQEAMTAPTTLDGGHSEMLSDIPPFIDGNWIKVPFDRERQRACLTQSTFTLERVNLYPPPLNRREDDVILALRNNPIGGLGTSSKLLWFQRPDVPPGDWTVVVEAGRDCGSWLHPGTAETGPIHLGVVKLPGA